MTGAEDQVSVNQQVERSKMERDYQTQMATLSDELNRVRQELTSRTEVMGQEMERWRQTAEATSRCACAVGSKHISENHDDNKISIVIRKSQAKTQNDIECLRALAEALLDSSHAMCLKAELSEGWADLQ